jgi:cob(I)alamin adenosyltransferase
VALDENSRELEQDVIPTKKRHQSHRKQARAMSGRSEQTCQTMSENANEQPEKVTGYTAEQAKVSSKV